MNISCSKWNNWDVVICAFGYYKLIAGISAGPRILSLNYKESKNILYEDYTDFRVAEWRMHGGHRFTVAPESKRSYYPDNEPCEVDIMDSVLHVKAKVRPNGIRLSLSISKAATGDGFDIRHTLQNEGGKDWHGALWCITCVPRTAAVFGACDTFSCINFWPETDPLNWQQSGGQLTVKPGKFRGKAGWFYKHPLLTAVQKHTFTIANSDRADKKNCVDNGSNTEIFVCTDYAELETLSERMIVKAGGAVSHSQQWRVQ